MRRFYFILFTLFTLLTFSAVEAQQAERRTPRLIRGEDLRKAEKESAVDDLSVREQKWNKQLEKDMGRVRWMRVIYRELDLNKDENASLYYPIRPTNGEKNLFSTIFELIGQGKIAAYEYLDGYESFAEEHRMDYKYLLDNFHILYDSLPGTSRTDPATYVVNESDIPSDLVKKYYVKEVYYFDEIRSSYGVKVLAICPIMISYPDYTDEVELQTPMFWLPYESIRPYIAHTYLMTSAVNNAHTYSIDDFFTKRLYHGEIIKVGNTKNLPLQAYISNPDSLKMEQERIENELKAFEEALWRKPSKDQVVPSQKGAKGKTPKRSVRTMR